MDGCFPSCISWSFESWIISHPLWSIFGLKGGRKSLWPVSDSSDDSKKTAPAEDSKKIVSFRSLRQDNLTPPPAFMRRPHYRYGRAFVEPGGDDGDDAPPGPPQPNAWYILLIVLWILQNCVWKFELGFNILINRCESIDFKYVKILNGFCQIQILDTSKVFKQSI